jgi:hypothetical protein
MNIPILQSGQVMNKSRFIQIEEFYSELRGWRPFSQAPGDIMRMIHHLKGVGEVRKLTELYDQSKRCMIKFSSEKDVTMKPVLTKGHWGSGFTMDSSLVAYNEDGSIVEPNYTQFRYIFENGVFSRFDPSKIELGKIKEIQYDGKVKHECESGIDVFMVKCRVGNGFDTIQHLVLGDLNDCIFRADE